MGLAKFCSGHSLKYYGIQKPKILENYSRKNKKVWRSVVIIWKKKHLWVQVFIAIYKLWVLCGLFSMRSGVIISIDHLNILLIVSKAII